MTHEERQALAQQIQANPLFDVMMESIEAEAVEKMVQASNETQRLEAQLSIQAARTFRADCELFLRNKPTRKGAPA